jgi:hypothetical protein
MTKRTWAAVLVTALLTSLCWHAGTSLRSGRDKLWLISAVKVPGNKALDIIAEDMKNHRYDDASRRIEVLRQEWREFDREKEFDGNAIGNILVQFSRIDLEAATEASRRPQQEPPNTPQPHSGTPLGSADRRKTVD